MGSSDEMYRRGRLDAEHDDLNPFYYQHYYYYRRGYDDGRRRQRRPDSASQPAMQRTGLLVFALVLAMAVGGVIWLLQRPGPSLSSAERSTELAIPRAPTIPLPTVIPNTPTTAPEPTTPPAPVLRAGGNAVVVNMDNAVLVARSGPGRSQPVQARFREGTQVKILEGPVEADGYTWWRIEAEAGSGWCAERSPDGVVWLSPVG